MGIFSARTQHHADQSAAAMNDADYSESYRHYQEMVSEDPETATAALARAVLADRDNR